MPVMRCAECATVARPRSYHPLSLRIEVTVWFAAVVLAAGVAGWTALAESRSHDPGIRGLAMSAVRGSEPAERVEVTSTYLAPNPVVRTGEWILGAGAAAVRSAWWILLPALALSLWRQFATVEGCIHCGSRRLRPVPPEYLD